MVDQGLKPLCGLTLHGQTRTQHINTGKIPKEPLFYPIFNGWTSLSTYWVLGWQADPSRVHLGGQSHMGCHVGVHFEINNQHHNWQPKAFVLEHEMIKNNGGTTWWIQQQTTQARLCMTHQPFCLLHYRVKYQVGIPLNTLRCNAKLMSYLTFRVRKRSLKICPRSASLSLSTQMNSFVYLG